MSTKASPTLNQTLFASADDAEHGFYEALRTKNLNLMLQVWADDEDILLTRPKGERYVGSQEVQESWKQWLAQADEIQIETIHKHVVQNHLTAIHNLIEKVSFISKTGELSICYYTTNIYNKTASGWQMIQHLSQLASNNSLITEEYRNHKGFLH